LGGLISGMFHPILGGNSWHFTWKKSNRIGNNQSQKWAKLRKIGWFLLLDVKSKKKNYYSNMYIFPPIVMI
jgi:hypothetical protein